LFWQEQQVTSRGKKEGCGMQKDDRLAWPDDTSRCTIKQRGTIGRSARFVALSWVALLAASLFLVGHFSFNFPYFDEFDLVPYLTGDQPITWQSLWAQNNEHRLPLPKLAYLALVRLTGGDFRAALYFNVLAMGAVTALLLIAVQRARGRFRYSDAFIPLAGLGAAHADIFLWGFEIQFICSVLLAGSVLFIVTRRPAGLTRGAALTAGAALLLLPLCGANGLVLVPALALWLLYAGFREWRSPVRGGKLVSALAWMLALAACGVIGFYFHGYHDCRLFPHPASIQKLAWAFGQIMATGFGPVGRAAWPYSGVLGCGLLVASALYLLFKAWRDPAERLRALGLLCFLGAIGSLALGIAWGRAEYPVGYTFDIRYGILVVPSLFAVYVSSVVYGKARGWRVIQSSLFFLFLLLLPINWRPGLGFAHRHAQQMEKFRQEVAAGTPVHILAKWYAGPEKNGLYPWTDLFEQYLRDMHTAGLGGLQALRLDEDFDGTHEMPFRAKIVGTQTMTWDRGHGHGWGHDPAIVFQLDECRFVSAVRLNVGYRKQPEGKGTASLQVYWKRSARHEFCEESSRTQKIPIDSSTHQITIWIMAYIDQLRLDPDDTSCEFEFSDMTLLVPGNGTAEGDAIAVNTLSHR
jgi:hypothetical protein